MIVWLLCESWGFARGYKQGGGVGLVQPQCPKGAHPLGHHFFCLCTSNQKGSKCERLFMCHSPQFTIVSTKDM